MAAVKAMMNNVNNAADKECPSFFSSNCGPKCSINNTQALNIKTTNPTHVFPLIVAFLAIHFSGSRMYRPASADNPSETANTAKESAIISDRPGCHTSIINKTQGK